MTRPRIAVVGAGPAGSTAARLLAEMGADVSLFEARRLPRPKTCGGGLTPKAQRLVPSAALGTVERRVDRVELRGPHLPALRLSVPEASIAMVERARFDVALVEEAARAGAVVRDLEPVRELLEHDSGIDLRTDRGRWHGDLLVVADGEPSGSARQLGLGGPARRRALALEVDVPFGTVAPTDSAILDYRIPGGYGWYFPKGDHANLGVGSYRTSRHSELRQDLARLAHELGLELGQGRVRGHWIAQSLRTGPIASRRAVLTGDAAATADAFFGEGISYAIVSGVAAAHTIADWVDGSIDGLQAYDARLRAVLGPALDRLDVIARAAELSITGTLVAVRLSGRAREQAVDAIAGRREPFVIDGHCALACACELHGITRSSIPTRFDRTSVPSSGHCRQCTTACAA